MQEEECGVCHVTTGPGHKTYHARYLFALERFHMDSFDARLHEQEQATRNTLRPIIETSQNEEEYTAAAVEYIKTFFRHSVYFALWHDLRAVKSHPLIDEYIPLVIVRNWPQHVYSALWKRYGSTPDVIDIPDSPPLTTGEPHEYYVYRTGHRKREKLLDCPICHTRYVLPEDRKEHVQRHERWLQDASVTEAEYRKLLAVDNSAFKNIRVPGYYYADHGLYRKDITNQLYDYQDTEFRRGDMLNHLELELLHQRTIGLSAKQKRRMAYLFEWNMLEKITENDDLWQTVKERLNMERLFAEE